MKKVSWSSIIIGFLSGIGGFLVAAFAIGIPLALFTGIRSKSMMSSSPLFSVFFFLLFVGGGLLMGFVTSKLARPYGVFNATLLAFMVALCTGILSLSAWRPILPFMAIAVGGVLSKQSR